MIMIFHIVNTEYFLQIFEKISAAVYLLHMKFMMVYVVT